MKNTMLKYGFLLWATVAVIAAAFVACEQEEEDYVSLEAFGPTPLKRGETVRFIGSNLNRVTAVVFPENIEVAPTVVSSGEITAIIPAAAANGYITLRYPGGSITSKSRIAYADAVAFDSIYGAASPVRAGDTITVTGDNLTGVSQVVFSVEVAVESRDFLTQSRHEITLALPANAQAGDVYLLAGAEETSHRTLSVDGPSITALAPTQPKPGSDTLLITGTNLDLAVSVIFAGDVTVDAVPVSATQIKAAVPADAQDGAIKVVSKAGLEYESPDALTLLAPSNLTLTAGPYKTGSSITISGNDLDLVTGVTFTDGVSVEDFSYDEATGITVVIPATATDGAITLLRVAGDGVATPDVTLVKPAITSITPATIQAGDAITITGTDLDLVTAVSVGGKACTIDAQTETEIQATTPMDAAIAGAGVEVALTLANGVSVTGAIDVTFPLYCFILELPAPDVEIKAGELLKVTVENSSKLTGVEVNSSVVQHILQGSTLYVAIPGNAGGSTSLKLISSNGDATYTINVIASGPVETVISTEMVDLGGWANTLAIPAADLAAAPGTQLKIYYTSTAANPQFKIMTVNDWDNVQVIDDPNYDAQWKVVGVPEAENTSSWSFVLDETMLAAFASNGGIRVGGQNIIISKVAVVTSGAPAEIIVDEAPHTVGWNQESDGEPCPFRINKAQLTELQAGSILKFYYTYTGSGDPQFKFMDANWGQFTVDDPNFDTTYGTVTVDADGSFYEWRMTADIVTTIMATVDGWSDTALVIGGQNLTVTKITIAK
ncbi:MAG: IPT/TIG domain-containing protein [Prevotellaceae bacterium]|jgi:hypothetical protein|nr:IPT/TIG domain-containing protein [Prevotellaceae bacterium]